MKVILDSNILFSILIKPDGKVASLFHSLTEKNDVFISDFRFEELNKHHSRLLKISGLSFSNFETLKYAVLKQLSIIPSNLFTEDIIQLKLQH